VAPFSDSVGRGITHGSATRCDGRHSQWSEPGGPDSALPRVQPPLGGKGYTPTPTRRIGHQGRSLSVSDSACASSASAREPAPSQAMRWTVIAVDAVSGPIHTRAPDSGRRHSPAHHNADAYRFRPCAPLWE
jgi:hypothetical protein